MLSEVENIRLSIFKCPLIHGRGGGGRGTRRCLVRMTVKRIRSMTSSTTRDTSEKFTSTSCRREVVLAAGPDVYLRREHRVHSSSPLSVTLFFSLPVLLLSFLPAQRFVHVLVSVMAWLRPSRPPAPRAPHSARHARPDVRTDKTERQRGGR